jgi:hypothetical protein
MYHPLIMVVGSVVLQALVFVNFSHALEAIFCDDDDSIHTQYSSMYYKRLALKKNNSSME